MKSTFLLFALLGFSASLAADVQIKLKDGDGRVSTISSNGKTVRIEDGMMPGYVLIDYAGGEFMMVDTTRGQVLHSRIDAGSGGSSAAGGSARLVDRGKGPRIAGYATRKFAFSTGGIPCGTIYASRELLEDRNVKAMFESMRTMQQKSRGMMGGMSGLLNDCQRANLQLAETLETSGAPLRIVDADGRLQSEVIAIDTSASHGRQYYEAPAGMARVDLEQQMETLQQQTGQIMQQLPDLDQMMQQMQDSGQMTEEMQQQMQKMMQQLKQLQQPQE